MLVMKCNFGRMLPSPLTSTVDKLAAGTSTETSTSGRPPQPYIEKMRAHNSLRSASVGSRLGNALMTKSACYNNK